MPEGVEIAERWPQDRLRGIMSRSQMMVLPGVEEGLALVQAQAMTCGCPVIASENTGARDLLTYGVERFIVSNRSSESIAHCSQELADDPARRETTSHSALERALSMGGWHEYGERMIQVLTKLTDTRHLIRGASGFTNGITHVSQP